MNRDWNDFKALNGNIAGAREAFEDACETLFRKMNPDRYVSQVKVKSGDGGIDIFIGELGIEPITIIQCKFFLESFESSQKSQIRESFNTAINSEKFIVKEWILCIPRIIDIDENSWWFKWKHKNVKIHNKEANFIKLIGGNELIDLFKEYSLYNEVFKIKDSLLISEIHKAVVPQAPLHSVKDSPHLILFNNYSYRCEPYYLEREIDKIFINSLSINNIWVFGDSGIGKTVLVNRNLLKNNVEYCFCDLSPIQITNAEQVIEEILCNIEEKFCVERNKLIKNSIKQAAQLLCHSKKQLIVIVIDELSVKEDDILKGIANELIKLVVYYNNLGQSFNLKFVISTIANPTKIIENLLKASDHFQFINCNKWDGDLGQLFELLSQSLGVNLQEYKAKVLDACENSPRILKSILRKIIAINNFTSSSVENAIKLTLAEVVK